LLKNNTLIISKQTISGKNASFACADTDCKACRKLNYKKFTFRIHTIRTDRGHEFQSQFHWHVEDKGIRHVYIKPRSPRIDQEEFYQLLTYTDDVDLNEKLNVWEKFDNFITLNQEPG